MTTATTTQAIEMLIIEEADAWFEYLETTKDLGPSKYRDIEGWAWARLSQRLRGVRARRAKLEAA